jgi:radical SAM superfamily enzyme YgiQ (UPF0313 family)
MKLRLIVPVKKGSERENWNGNFNSLMSGIERYSYITLALPTLAALTPPDFEVKITDENIEKIDFEEKTDIVGITCNTHTIIRAYEIADEFRKKGVRVILGGIHPSMLPDEAIQHSDAVVIGEAENVWAGLLKDFKEGNLKRFYKSQEKPSLDNVPIPRWDLLKNEKYVSHVIQTTRGCPYECEFCSVKPMLGTKIRYKPVENVLREIETLTGIQNKLILFADDNIMGNRENTKELINRLIKLNITYIVQIPISIAKDDEMLELFAKSKCKKFYIGFESIFGENLKQMNKAKCNKAEEYAENIEKIQSYGIEVYGSFIFGYDFDDESVFEKTVKFINDTNIANPVVTVLTPLPGTRLFERFRYENRLLHTDWSKYDLNHVCFMPKMMSPEALQNGYLWARQQIYSYESIFKRLKYIWSLWNKNNARLWDRVSPVFGALSNREAAYSYPEAVHPMVYKEQCSIEKDVVKV